MAMTDVRLDGEIGRCGIEVFRTCGAADAVRMHLTRVGGDFVGGFRGSVRIASANLVRKFSDVLGVALGAVFGLNLAPAFAQFGIVETLLLGTCERIFRDQDALPFVSLSRAAEAQNDGAQRRVLRCAAGDAGISSCNEREMSEVCAVDAESSGSLFSEEVAFEQLTAALIALRIAAADDLENENFFACHEEIVVVRKASGQGLLAFTHPSPVR